MLINKNKNKLIYPKLSYLVNGICFEAHNQLGRYSREKQYGDYLEKRLKEEGVKYERELSIGETGNKADFLIEDKLVLELKVKRFITKKDYYQIQRYLQATGKKLGIIVNFSNVRLKPKRIIKVEPKV